MKWLFLLCIAFWATLTQAQVLLPEDVIDITTFEKVFVAPNEKYPQKSDPIVTQVPAGLMLTVGTERGFITAAMAPAVTDLLLVDRSKEVVVYNQLNILLLALSESRQDYLFLRLQASQQEWMQRLAKSSFDSPQARRLFSHDYWWRWDDFIRQSSLGDFADFHRSWPKNMKPCTDCFEGVNYLFEDKLYAKLSRLAKEGRMEAHLLDLSRPSEMSRLSDAIARQNKRLALFDLSNAWQPQYLKPEILARLLATLSPVMHAEGVFMVTENRSFGDRFDYFGFRFSVLHSFTTMAEFVTERFSKGLMIVGEYNQLSSEPKQACGALEFIGTR